MNAEEYYGGDQLAIDTLRSKYLHEGEAGPDDMWKRVAKAIAGVEKTKELKEEWEKKFYDIMKDFHFVPGGRVNHAAGFEKKGARLPSLSNCYFIPIKEDSTEAIMDWCKEAALVYRSGGGVGTDISILRPRGASVNASVGKAPGGVSFMNLMSEVTETIAQNGRRGALMITIRVDHPDVEDFITIKSDKTTVKHANISVKLTDEFMQAVIADADFDLRWNGKVFKTVKAKALWDKIIAQAHSFAEPGLMFWDHMTADHNLEYADPIMGTNPCGEIPLPAYDACNLGHINVSKCVDPNGRFWKETFEHLVSVGIRFLDNVITYNVDRHALPIISKQVTENRRTGLGITGLADALLKMHIKYDSKEALDFVESLMETLRNTAYKTSSDLAAEKGSFTKFNVTKVLKAGFVSRLPDDIKDGIRRNGLRNCTLLTVAPVGTGSIIAQCSSGLEPIFQYWYERDVKSEAKRGELETYRVYHKTIRDLFGEVESESDLPDYVVNAHQIDAKFRIKMQAVIQKYIDSSISSTINLPEATSKAAVAKIYIDAWKHNLKGVTVYREGSREGVLRSIKEEKQEKIKKREFALGGETFKIPIKSGSDSKKLYITINGFNDDPHRPFEVFINTYGDPERNADLEALSMTLSALFRREDDLDFLMEKYVKLFDPSINAWWYDQDLEKGSQITSIPKAIAIAYYKFKSKKNGRRKKDTILDSPIFCETCD